MLSADNRSQEGRRVVRERPARRVVIRPPPPLTAPLRIALALAVVPVVFNGLRHPTAVRFASDRRVFVAQKSGIGKVFNSLSIVMTSVADHHSGAIVWGRSGRNNATLGVFLTKPATARTRSGDLDRHERRIPARHP